MKSNQELFNIKISAAQLIDLLYESYLTEPQCYPILTTRADAVASFMVLIRNLCTQEWDLLDAELEGMFRQYQGAALKDQRVD